MKNRLIITLLLLVTALLATTCTYRQKARRLALDRMGLVARLEQQRLRSDSLTAQCEVLRLDRDEFRRLYQAESEQLKKMRIRLKRVEAVGQSVTQTLLQAPALRYDTIRLIVRDTTPLIDTLRRFRWCDPWNRVEGVITQDTVHCRVQAVDTLRQIVHRIPHRFLFIRWGTKALRQEIRSSNPSTRIVYTEYVMITR